MHIATSGHYTALYNALDLGKTDEGWFLELTLKGEMVRFEEFSQNVVDMIYQGADVVVETVLKEWRAAGLQGALWPFSTTFGKIDCSGQFAALNEFAKPLILTPNSCSPAGTDGPTFTFSRAVLEPDIASRINLNNKTRMVPLRFRTFLQDVGTNDFRYFSIT